MTEKNGSFLPGKHLPGDSALEPRIRCASLKKAGNRRLGTFWFHGSARLVGLWPKWPETTESVALLFRKTWNSSNLLFTKGLCKKDDAQWFTPTAHVLIFLNLAQKCGKSEDKTFLQLQKLEHILLYFQFRFWEVSWDKSLKSHLGKPFYI